MTQVFEDNESMVLTIVGVVVALWLIISLLLKIWPFLSKFVTMVNAIVGHDDEPGVIERLQVLEENSERETLNHQKMSDQFDRVETKLSALTRRFDEFSVESSTDRQKLWELARQHHQGEIEE
jgi:hypothetical protein